MSLGVESEPTAPPPDARTTAGLRALAHPLRLQMLSLLTGASLSAAEVARELEITHANASYHLRQLEAAGQIQVVEEVTVRGGHARRYRHTWDDRTADVRLPPAERRLVWAAVAAELVRRAAAQDDGPHTITDADLWVDPDTAEQVRADLVAASIRLHEAARPPRTVGTVRVNLTVAMFGLSEGA